MVDSWRRAWENGVTHRANTFPLKASRCGTKGQSLSPRQGTDSLHINVRASTPSTHTLAHTHLSPKCFSKPSGVCVSLAVKSYRRRELSWGGSAGSGCNLRPQEMEGKGSSGIMCRVTMKEWSHAIISDTKPTVNAGCMTLSRGGLVFVLVHSQAFSVLESRMSAAFKFSLIPVANLHSTFPTSTHSF